MIPWNYEARSMALTQELEAGPHAYLRAGGRAIAVAYLEDLRKKPAGVCW